METAVNEIEKSAANPSQLENNFEAKPFQNQTTMFLLQNETRKLN